VTRASGARRRLLRAGSSALVLALANCARDDARGSRVPVSGAGSANERAVRALSERRCARELRCARIGEGKPFASVDDCQGKLDGVERTTFNAERCPAGVDQRALAACLQDILDECERPLDSLERLVSCQSGKLCAG
jgi:hypothetical protein